MKFPEDPVGKYFRLSDKSHAADGSVMRCVETQHCMMQGCEEDGVTDWYRFDRGFEFGGSGLSTIPQIWGTRQSMTFEEEITRGKHEAEARERRIREGHRRHWERHAARCKHPLLTREEYAERNRRIFIWRFRAKKTYSWIAVKFGISAGRVQGICRKMQTVARHPKWLKAQTRGRTIPFAEPRGHWIIATHAGVTVCELV